MDGAVHHFFQIFQQSALITWQSFIRFLTQAYKKQRDSSNFPKKNYLNYLGHFVGQMAVLSPPCWMATGAHKIQVGPDRVWKGLVLDWYQTL